MSEYVISASSTTDFTKTEAGDTTLLQFAFIFGEDEYPDNFWDSMPSETFYGRVRGGEMPTSSMINVPAYMEYFKSVLESGKDVFHIELSSGISGSCSNGFSVARELNESGNYNNKVYFVDSLCASRGYALFVDVARGKKAEGLTADELYAWAEENKRNFIHWFTVDDLNHLRRGGRVSGVSAFLGSMLNIKPVLNVDDEGKLIPRFKIRGRKKSILEMVERMVGDIKQPDGQTAWVCHGDCIDDAQFLADEIKKALPMIKEVKIGLTGPVIGCHSGPGTLALFYIGEKRFEDRK